MSVPQGGVGPGSWLDDHAPDPTWGPPSRPGEPADREPGNTPSTPSTPSQYRRRGPHPLLVGIVAVAVSLAGIWALGGFANRKDAVISAEPGRPIVTGPYELVFTEATAQRITRLDKTIVEVKVLGTGRTTGTEALAPTNVGNMFAARDGSTGEIEEAQGQQLGGGFDRGERFTPGLPPTAYVVRFEFSDSYRAGRPLRFAVAELEYTDNSLLGDDEKTWNNGDRQFLLSLPVRQLPAQD